MKRARDIMSGDVVYLHPNDSIFDAAKLFSELDIHGLPVVRGERLVGMITVTDIVKFIDIKIDNLPELKSGSLTDVVITIFKTLKSSETLEREMHKISTTKIEDIMTKDLITVSQNTPFIEIAKLMEEHKIHRMPVVSRNRLVGIITGVDLMKVMIEPHARRKVKIPKTG
ncbi:MAG: hypothetical protein COY38_01450 [Candidatus Aenigmarchaeota archaeon CG_4_10_14_0_8_um_filter_37_24]|nr:CBS domain-containing protein [Candidatus Aenigmarchaeota archaeon]OIN88542.1 MAG: hypothetical protein AUJ50_00715 [Candidatus Aenigmarchaeota archaeon CG1_02_38_14]PIV68885.1 MAG: hypothetical protein COS07_02800 [Candidatus Aenigmarchaeota archaeon CG01_land_8_20_14_3_00_37_9]PIW41068.1 MAG: hypothetical protein COW21_03715 [Candidatus Aenigmarchaeota archaeon CG15_BIG_FIL_POST_REV_8_21_14_020_37_27]PIX50917.1 MAG: hypothetical protein COZ52_01515 [Candidatus Aenigmarchaeota archaeon CG_4